MAFFQAPNIFLPWYNTFGTLLQLSGDCKWCPVFSLTRFLLVLNSHMWRTGTPLKILKRTPKRYEDVVLWMWTEFFKPLWVAISKAISGHTFFWFNTIRGNTKVPIVDLLRLNNLRATQAALLTHKRHNEHPALFCNRVPPCSWVLPQLIFFLRTILFHQSEGNENPMST